MSPALTKGGLILYERQNLRQVQTESISRRQSKYD